MCLVIKSDPNMRLLTIPYDYYIGLKKFSECNMRLLPLHFWDIPYTRLGKWYIPLQTEQDITCHIGENSFAPRLTLGAHVRLVPTDVSYSYKTRNRCLTEIGKEDRVYLVGFAQRDIQMVGTTDIVVSRFFVLTADEVKILVTRYGVIEQIDGDRQVFRFNGG